MADLRTYRGRSLPEILRRVRAELGANASILHTREVGSRLTRWLGGGELEVVASNEVDVPSRLSTVRKDASQHDGSTPSERTADSEARFITNPAPPNGFEHQSGDAISGLSEASDPMLAHLRSLGTPPALCRRWLERLQPARSAHEHTPSAEDWVRVAEEELTIHGPIRIEPGRRRVVAVVGPTGVGKTTTIAKLAGNLQLKNQTRVGLITLDTFRIAAVDQLQTYAQIMEAPLEVVGSPREMSAALQRLAHCELVLIDTIGRSPFAAARIRELRALLAEARTDETHLALSAASSRETLSDCLEAFAPLQPTAMILTKCDEARRLAPLWPILADSALPLSYTTHGQHVPDDIRLAHRRELAHTLLGLEVAAPWTAPVNF
jgi:flagellar biosynthesis protein FlhF